MFNLFTYCLALPIKLLLNRILWYRKPKKLLLDELKLINVKSKYSNPRISLHGNNLYEHGLASYILKEESYTFNEKITQATAAFVNLIGRPEEGFYTVLASSITVNNEGNYSYTTLDTDEKSLLGFMLALVNDDSILLREKYEFLLNSILTNNYCLVNLDKTPSKYGNFSPNPRLTPSQMNTIMAVLKFGASLGIKDAKIHYKKLTRLGYGLFKSDNAIANFILLNKGNK